MPLADSGLSEVLVPPWTKRFFCRPCSQSLGLPCRQASPIVIPGPLGGNLINTHFSP